MKLDAPHLVRSVLAAYRDGWFPMGDPVSGVVEWVQPHLRGVIPLEPGGLRVSRSLRRRVRSGRFAVRSDAAFGEVVRACAAPGPGREQTWIAPSMLGLYGLLLRAGHAHSVEAYVRSGDGACLVGGVYGVSLGGAFFAESMFCRPGLGGTDAGKVCLVHLVHHLRRRGFVLLDVQMWNPHTGSLGCVEVARERFLEGLGRAAAGTATWGPFEPERTLGELGAGPG